MNKHRSDSIPSRTILGVKLITILICALATGCDEAPSIQANSIPPISDDVLGGAQRKTYVWRPTVSPPSDVNYSEIVDRAQLEKGLLSPRSIRDEIVDRPEWMNETLWNIYKRYRDAYKEPSLALSVSRSQTSNASLACFSRDGDKMWTISDQIIAWDLSAGRELNRIPSPLNGVVQAFYEPHLQSLLLHNGETIVRLSSENGQVLARWTSTVGKIANLDAARDSDLIAIVSNQKQLYTLHNQFQRMETCGNATLVSDSISVHPTGKWVLATTPKGLLRWFTTPRTPSIEELASQQLNLSQAIPLSMRRGDLWVDSMRAVGISHANQESDGKPAAYSALINPIIVHAQGAEQSDLVLPVVSVCLRGDETQKVSAYLQDFIFFHAKVEPQSAWKIPFDDFKWLGASPSGDYVAFLVEDTIRVYRRQAFQDPQGATYLAELTARVLAGHTEHIEEMLDAVLPKSRDPLGRSSNTLMYSFVLATGEGWQSLETTSPDSKILEKLEEWRNSGSEVACLCSAYRFFQRVVSASKSNSNKQLEVSSQITGELDRIRKPARFAPLIETQRIDMLAWQASGSTDVEACLKRALETDPYYTNASHRLAVYYMRHGKSDEIGSLFSSIAQAYPDAEAERRYLTMSLSLMAAYKPYPFQTNQHGIDYARLLSTAMPLLRDNELSRLQIEILIQAARLLRQTKNEEQLSTHLFERFGSVASRANVHESEPVFLNIKRRRFPDGFRYRGISIVP
jgi:hypothetical protein